MPPVRTTLAALATAVLLASCGSGDLPADGSGGGTSAPTAPAASALDALATPEKVPQIARAKFGEALTVRRIYLSRTGFTMQVRDPAKPENLDDYSYSDGQWTSRPVSVSLSEIATFDDTTFGIGAVNWKAVPSLMQQALAGLDLEDEEISGVSYDRLAGEKPRVYIGVNGLRGNGRLIARADGTEVEVSRN